MVQCVSPSDGWCEVCVNGWCQAIVVEITVHARAEIHSLHHAAGGQNPQQGVEVRKVLNCRIVQGISQSFGWIYVDVKVLEKGNKTKSKKVTKILQTFKMWGWLYPSRWVAAWKSLGWSGLHNRKDTHCSPPTGVKAMAHSRWSLFCLFGRGSNLK